MQLKQLIQDIAEYTVKNEIVECAMGGLSLYEINFKENNNYPLLFISPSTNHTISNNTITYQIVIYYIDRLLRDNDNNIDIVNASVSKLQQIINIIKSFDNVLKLNPDYQINNFADTQRLTDNVAGGYVNLSITVQNTQGVCAIDAVLPTLKVVLQNKNVEITENGEYNITFDNGYTGLKEVNVDVNIDTQSYYQEGYNTGYTEGNANGREEQKSLLESITITENGVYDNENGYDEITVEVDTSGAYNEGFDNGKVEGKEEGKAEQKALIQPITITENGVYSNENGYSPIDVSIDTDSYFNEGYNEGFSKGESEGYNEGYDVGVVNGKEQQKSLLESIKIVNNGVYNNENGYDEITVEIDTQSYYDNGYNTGYSEGEVNGVEQGKEEQKALLESITIKENGTYTNENGYDEVIVDVPTGGGDTGDYEEGYNKGYEEGVANIVKDAEILNVTKNGTYKTKYSDVMDATGYYDDGTPFFSYALLNNISFDTQIKVSPTTTLEIWFKSSDYSGYDIPIIGSQNFVNTSAIFKIVKGYGAFNADIGTKSIRYYTEANKWYYVEMSFENGLWVNGEKLGDYSSNVVEPTYYLFINNLGYYGFTGTNNYIGMIKIDGQTIIPKEQGFYNVTTDTYLPIHKSGEYIFTEVLPPAEEGLNLIKEVIVNIDTQSYYDNGYNTGYSEGEVNGIEQGKEEQKSLLETITITENGIYDNDNGYDEITVEIDTQSYYDNGYNTGYSEGETNGKEEQKSLLESITITENGIYDNDNGYDEITVEIDTQSYYDNGYNTGYSEGETNGKEEQKSLLESITITENGTYTNENGYDEVIVDVPTGGGDTGDYEEGYNKGYEEGKAEQKSLLESITITENGTYTNENGYDEVIVDVPTGGGDTSKLKLPNGISLASSTFSTIDMSKQDWSNVYDWGYMFDNCKNLTDIQNFPTNVEILSTKYMFNNCENLITLPELNTSNVTNMGWMFYNCQKLTSIPQIDTSNVLTMERMFYNCQKLTSIPALDTSNVTNMYYTFNSCRKLTSIPALDTSNVTNMDGMFNYCLNLTSIPALDTSNVTNMGSMFYNCTNLTSIPQIDTSNVTNMSNMFYRCSILTSIPLLNTSNVTNMNSMFFDCQKLTSIPALDTSNVTNMGSMFFDCQKLTSIPALDTSNVTNMNSMFNGCTKLEEVKFKGNPQYLTNVSSMFSSAGSSVETPKMYYPQEFETNYQKIINVLPSKWTAVPY